LLRGQGSIPERPSSPFRFQACWLTHDDYPTVVNNAWKNGEPYITDSLNRVRDDSLTFNKEVFGNIFKRKKDIEKQLQHVQMIERVDSIHLNMEEANLQKMYQEVLKHEELLWYQKSREKWVKFGDKNNKFFHTQTIIRRKRNKIQGLHLDDGTWCTGVMQLWDVAIEFYSKLFQNDVEVYPDSLKVELLPSLNSQGRNSLIKQMTKVEVRNAIFFMQSFKAPGPDGFQPLFFKHFWDAVGEDIWKYVMQSFSSGYIDDKIAKTLLVLVLKENNPTRLKNFRPISLCNVIFKVITKVLVNVFALSLMI